ncbi:hypothetical protein PAPYR_3525 [Paratrimastix pyriformis]|uniref:VWFA domain-containing protein n=1 Tax=Paratrimastix pyriformis TaxID=342808 RepID=A0ABQ8USZ3_9EUKA|nr:hypothetical protein PAPYR_3525 [Paratrimastix pyriformis]
MQNDDENESNTNIEIINPQAAAEDDSYLSSLASFPLPPHLKPLRQPMFRRRPRPHSDQPGSFLTYRAILQRERLSFLPPEGAHFPDEEDSELAPQPQPFPQAVLQSISPASLPDGSPPSGPATRAPSSRMGPGEGVAVWQSPPGPSEGGRVGPSRPRPPQDDKRHVRWSPTVGLARPDSEGSSIPCTVPDDDGAAIGMQTIPEPDCKHDPVAAARSHADADRTAGSPKQPGDEMETASPVQGDETGWADELLLGDGCAEASGPGPAADDHWDGRARQASDLDADFPRPAPDAATSLAGPSAPLRQPLPIPSSPPPAPLPSSPPSPPSPGIRTPSFVLPTAERPQQQRAQWHERLARPRTIRPRAAPLNLEEQGLVGPPATGPAPAPFPEPPLPFLLPFPTGAHPRAPSGPARNTRGHLPTAHPPAPPVKSPRAPGVPACIPVREAETAATVAGHAGRGEVGGAPVMLVHGPLAAERESMGPCSMVAAAVVEVLEGGPDNPSLISRPASASGGVISGGSEGSSCDFPARAVATGRLSDRAPASGPAPASESAISLGPRLRSPPSQYPVAANSATSALNSDLSKLTDPGGRMAPSGQLKHWAEAEPPQPQQCQGPGVFSKEAPASCAPSSPQSPSRALDMARHERAFKDLVPLPLPLETPRPPPRKIKRRVDEHFQRQLEAIAPPSIEDYPQLLPEASLPLLGMSEYARLVVQLPSVPQSGDGLLDGLLPLMSHLPSIGFAPVIFSLLLPTTKLTSPSIPAILACILFAWATRATETTVCTDPLDALLVFDSSSSLTASDFNDTKAFALECVRLFNVDDFRAHMGIIQFATFASLEMCITGTAGALELATNHMKQLYGQTDISVALRAAHNEMEANSRTDPGRHRMVILLSDGICDGIAAIAAAKELAADGIEIYPIAVGPKANTALLQRIATKGNVSALVQGSCRIDVHSTCDGTIWVACILITAEAVATAMILCLDPEANRFAKWTFRSLSILNGLIFIFSIVLSSLGAFPASQSAMCVLVLVCLVAALCILAAGTFNVFFKMVHHGALSASQLAATSRSSQASRAVLATGAARRPP